MSVTSFYAFSRPSDSLLLEAIDTSREAFPEKFPYRIGVFLHQTGILNKRDMTFEKDIDIIAQHCGIEITKDEEQKRLAYLKLDREALATRYPDTLKRFQEGAKDFGSVALAGFSQEYFERMHTIQIDQMITQPKRSFLQRGLSAAYRFLMS